MTIAHLRNLPTLFTLTEAYHTASKLFQKYFNAIFSRILSNGLPADLRLLMCETVSRELNATLMKHGTLYFLSEHIKLCRRFSVENTRLITNKCVERSKGGIVSFEEFRIRSDSALYKSRTRCLWRLVNKVVSSVAHIPGTYHAPPHRLVSVIDGVYICLTDQGCPFPSWLEIVVGATPLMAIKLISIS